MTARRPAERRIPEEEAAMRARVARRKLIAIDRLSGVERVVALRRAKMLEGRAARVNHALSKLRRQRRNDRRREKYRQENGKI